MSFRSILVAVDGSRHSDTALAHAIELARDGNARLTILTATPSAPGASLTGPGAVAAAAAASRIEHDFVEILRAAVDRVPDDLPVTSVHASGPAAQRWWARRSAIVSSWRANASRSRRRHSTAP